MRKHINSETTNYQDELTEVLVLDDKPVVNSFNGITSDAVARAVAGASGEVPQVTEGDNGKVLKAIYDEGGPAVEWGSEATVDQTYSASSTNAQSGTAVAGAIAGVKQVPASTSADASKVLTVNSEGVPGWADSQGGGGGSSVEAGPGLVKSGDTLSVKTGTTTRLGDTMYGSGSNSKIGFYGANIFSATYLNMSTPPSRYVGSSEDTPTAYLYLINGPTQGSETARGRYNKLSFSTVKDGNYLKIVGFPGGIDVNFAQGNIDMQLGNFLDLYYVSGSIITTYISFGYEDGQGNVTFFNEDGAGSVFNNSNIAAAVPFASTGQAGFVPVVDATGNAAWSKSVFQAAYSLGGTKPTYTVDGNKIIIAASGNTPLTDSVKGIAPDGNYIKKLAILSMRAGLNYDYALYNTGVNAKIALLFMYSENLQQTWTFTGFRGLRGYREVDLMCELPLYFNVRLSSSVMRLYSITIELTDDDGQAVSLSSSGQLADFGLLTHRLP